MMRGTRSHTPTSGIKPEVFSDPPIIEGLLWRDEWRAPTEGPLTLLWKIALANCLTARELCSKLFGTHLLLGEPSGPHGRTLLTPRWMIGARGRPTWLGHLVRRGGLDMASPGWAAVVASDEHLRYCKACITEGYQSVYCQIDGLRRCPVHGLSLLDVCTACGAPTTRYALTGSTMAYPYHCSACGEPLGEWPWSPTAQRTSASLIRKWIAPYHAIKRWMSNVERLELSWPSLMSWQCSNEGQQGDVERRIAVFEVLRQLVPLALTGGCIREPAIAISMNFYHAKAPATLVQFRQGGLSPEWDVRRDAYIAIRRHISRMLMRRHRACLRNGADALHVEWDSEVLHPTARVCPLVFGYYLWRHHFELSGATQTRTGALGRGVALRDEALAWPVERDVGVAAWTRFAVMSFFAYVKVAKEWSARTETIVDPYGKGSAATMMQLLSDFRVALSPRYLAWSSRITFFFDMRRRLSEGEWIAIVGPTGSLHELLQDTCDFGVATSPRSGSSIVH